MSELGWKSVLGVLELTALPSVGADRWVPGPRDRRPVGEWWRRAVSVPLDAAIRARGPLAVAARAVWVGFSAGGMVMTPRIGEDFVHGTPPAGGDETLGIVDFSICPAPGSGRHAGQLHGRGRAVGGQHRGFRRTQIDNQTAIQVVDGTIKVFSEGHWKLFTPSPQASESG